MKYGIYALLVAITLAAPGAYAKAKKSEKQADAKAEKKANAKPKVVTKEDGLVIEDIKLGDGIEAKEGSRVKVHYFDSEQFETAGTAALERMDAIVVPGGFGRRGTEGKILAIRFARERRIPYLGKIGRAHV